MSLISAFHTARTALDGNASMLAVTSRNISGAGDVHFSYKQAKFLSDSSGLRFMGIERVVDASLQRSLQETISRARQQDMISGSIQKIAESLSINAPDRSIPGRISSLSAALQTASIQPSNPVVLSSIFDAGQSLAASINAVSEALVDLRREADQDVRRSIERINTFLERFGSVQSEILRQSDINVDISSLLDDRDAILSALAEEVGISVVEASDGSLSIYAAGGAVLFNREARSVSVSFADRISSEGLSVEIVIDGANVSSPSSVMKVDGGRLGGALSVRDSVLPQVQLQVDELARGLVIAFAHTSAIGDDGAFETVPGLFVLDGWNTLGDSASVPQAGLRFAINPQFDPSRGGDLSLLLGVKPVIGFSVEGVASSPATRPALEGIADYYKRLHSNQNFSISSGLISEGNVQDYAMNIISFVASRRQESQALTDQLKVTQEQFQAALSSKSGVNLDEEMTRLLQVENNYRATTKLIAALDNIYSALFSAMR